MASRAPRAANAQPAMMSRSDLFDAFRRRGWVKQSAELFFDGTRFAEHPHLHMRLARDPRVMRGRDIRLGVGMLAFSDGQQGRGGGGTTFISDGEVTRRDPLLLRGRCNDAMWDELTWIYDYFTTG
jgi:hypothetical protein